MMYALIITALQGQAYNPVDFETFGPLTPAQCQVAARTFEAVPLAPAYQRAVRCEDPVLTQNHLTVFQCLEGAAPRKVSGALLRRYICQGLRF